MPVRFSVLLPLLALLTASPWAPMARAQSPSEAALSRAHALHVALLQQPVGDRRAGDYQAIVAVLEPLFRPADKDEAAQRLADSARYEAASVYVAEARDLQQAEAYRNAARIFLDLLHQSPYTAYRRNAEFALAQIQIFHLHQNTAAAVWLRDFEKRYPADPRAALAQREARGQRVPEPAYLTESEPAALPPVPSPAPPVRLLNTAQAGAAVRARVAAPDAASPSPAPRTDAPPPAAGAHALAVRLGNVTGVRVFSNPHASSVVIALRRESTFTRSASPARGEVTFEISTAGAPRAARAPAAAPAGALEVHDGRIETVRVDEITHKGRRVVRVTIRTAAGVHLDRGRFFPNPDRLVIAATAARPAPRR